jgi:uncharacterized protein YggT (Ycf19 family)
MERDEIAVEEARRIEQHGRVKNKLGDSVRAGIAEKARSATPAEQAEMESVAKGLKHQAAAEVVETEVELQRGRQFARVGQVVDYLFFLAYSLIGLEIGLELFGARQSSGFKQFLDVVTLPLLRPFRGLMPDPALGSLQLMTSYVVALVVYALAHLAVKKLLRLLAHREGAL